MLHVIGLPSGKDMQRPAPFLPANASWSEPVAVGTTLYAATTGACGNASTVYAIDLDNADQKRVVSWQTNGGPIVGSIAFAGDGTLIVAVGAGQTTGDGRANAIVALDQATLQVKDWFTQPNADFVTGPTILRRGDRDIVAAATRDGRVLLLDAASLGGANHSTPLFASQAVTAAGGSVAGTLSTWQEATFAPVPDDAPAGTQPEVTLGTQWVLVPVNGRPAASAATNGAVSTGAVVAYRVVDAGASLALEAGWTSHDLAAPATPIIVNGVVFALGTGRPDSASGTGTPAVLHAYDGANGRALWTSGSAITAFASPGSFWSAMSQVYVGASDGNLYAFGFLDERR